MSQVNTRTRVLRHTPARRIGIVVGIVVMVSMATGCGASRDTAKPSGATNPIGSLAEVSSLLAGIPEHGSTLGNADAPVTLEYFGDLECPICREFTLGALPSIVREWVRSGKLKIEYRSMETATRKPEVFKTQQVAALAAGVQNKLWYFVELFYHEQGKEDTGYVTEGYLQGLAQQVPGLNLVAWSAARNDVDLAEAITTDAQAADDADFAGTPSFLLRTTGGTLYRYNPRTYIEAAPYNAVIERLLKGSEKRSNSL
jgi:protein-disulfide isomerase